ncbi:hypothetical protein [Mycolicibacterium komossense]|uniref:Uncharacterized protein n=1 Tax=Mycolicibacterium komossense TaxID=1779 RepID=A0ABT3C9I9_9MYCO|nr:hypothetical protein [Mycolicibacterium komossense]MCV7226100.1 hypothetical protein [Mycolicibacterium komossense]
MIGAVESLCTIAGDALSGLGAKLRTRREGFSDYHAGEFLLSGADVRAGRVSGRMESDGPDQTETIPADAVRFGLNDLPDSELMTIAATVLEGWTPLLFKATGATACADLLVAALRDRASQFRAVELDAGEPFLTPAHLGAHLTRSAQPASE